MTKRRKIPIHIQLHTKKERETRYKANTNATFSFNSLIRVLLYYHSLTVYFLVLQIHLDYNTATLPLIVYGKWLPFPLSFLVMPQKATAVSTLILLDSATHAHTNNCYELIQ